jgi:hypothetical protein
VFFLVAGFFLIRLILKNSVPVLYSFLKWLIAYASRAFTGAETRYAPIEKELLAAVYGMEKFYQ